MGISLSKKSLILLIVVLLLLAALAAVYILKPKIPGIKSEIRPRLVKKTTINQKALDSHPKLISYVLTYNLKTGIATRSAVNKFNADIPTYLSNPPKTLPGDFVYRAEVVSGNNQIIQSGWKNVPVEILRKDDDNILFSPIFVYNPGNKVKIYSGDGKLIWAEIME